jgi:hypothetical protein
MFFVGVVFNKSRQAKKSCYRHAIKELQNKNIDFHRMTGTSFSSFILFPVRRLIRRYQSGKVSSTIKILTYYITQRTTNCQCNLSYCLFVLFFLA